MLFATATVRRMETLLNNQYGFCKPVLSIFGLPLHLPAVRLYAEEGSTRIGRNKPSTMRVSLAHPLLGIHMRPHNLVFFQGSYPLPEGVVRRLIWRRVSRLDAFSGSPVPT